MQPTNPYLWPSYCNGATAREILRSSPKAWNQIKIATNANVTVLWDPLLLSSSDFPMNIPRRNSRAAFWLVEKNAENLLVNQIPLWAIGAQDISYLSCQVLLGFRTAPRDIRHFLKLYRDFQCLNTFFLHCLEWRGHGGMLGRIIGNALPHPATGSTLKKLPPSQPPAIWIARQFFFSLYSHF